MTSSEADRAFELVVNDLLTFIEQREAEQIAYGIYDVTMTGAEVLAAFRSLSAALADADERTTLLRSALQTLGECRDLLRLDPDPDAAPEAWVFRSRIAEMVRLIHLVRQRIVFAPNQRTPHRLRSSKRLVADTTLTVMSRLVPRRDQASQEIRERALNASDVYTGYTSHDLTNLVRDLQSKGELTGNVIWPHCRGKSGVVREILATIA